MRSWLVTIALSALLLAVALPLEAQGRRKQGQQLEKLQSTLAAAVRWGEFEQAWQLVDPAFRQANPMSELEFERYQQVQISGYSERASSVADDGRVLRDIELRVINRHTMAERTLRYQEQWRWDPEAKRWWLAGGLPDLWSGN
jgi:hypothetical protein